MTAAFIVRTATPADAAKLSTLATRTFVELLSVAHAPRPEDMATYTAKALSVEKMQAEIEDPLRTTLLVFPEDDPDTLCGYVMLIDDSVRPGDNGSPSDYLEVKRVYVDSPFHGTGAAYAMMEKAMEVVKSKNRKVVWLGTPPTNFRAQKFYRKHGFEITGEYSFLIGNSACTDVVLTLQA